MEFTKDYFNDLVRKYSIIETTAQEKEEILKAMRTNLLERNNGEKEYTIMYATPGVTYNIETCDYEGLRAVDYDMHTYGKLIY